jgi:predicted RNA-binding Zn ribbon-like protein
MAGTTAPLYGEPWPIEFANTLWADREGSHDALATPVEVDDWLAATTAVAPPLSPHRVKVGAAEVDDAQALRDAIRRLAAESTQDTRAAAVSQLALTRAVACVNEVAERAPRSSQLHWPRIGSPYRSSRSDSGPVAALLAELAEQAIELFSGPRREQLRACQGPGCVLYFVRDHPRREWCSAACGNRARVARHYRRHHG